MNEKKSIYEDIIIFDKINSNFIKNTSHTTKDINETININVNNFIYSKRDIPNYKIEQKGNNKIINFLSQVTTPYLENNHVNINVFETNDAKGNILLTHGLFIDSIEVFYNLIKPLCSKGFNVFFFKLPYHFERRPSASLLSGEYFMSGDLTRTKLALLQAVDDLMITYSLVTKLYRKNTFFLGYSVGSVISLVSSILFKAKKTFLINPLHSISYSIWHSKLCSKIKEDIISQNISSNDFSELFHDFDVKKVKEYVEEYPKIGLARSIYDQIVDRIDSDQLIDEFNIKTVLEYKAGHVNSLRMPRLANDVEDFFLRD